MICYYHNRGDNIRKNIGVVILAVSLALVFTKALFTTYETEQVMISSGNIYLLQYGSYINKEVMNENVKKLDDYLMYFHDDKYYVYVGAYINIDTARKMQKYFENENIYTYIKNDYISNSEVINKIEEIDNEILNEENYNRLLENNKKILNILKNIVS